MNALGKWSVEHRVSVNLIMVFLIVAGFFTVINMKREMFPQFSLDMINIGVTYPGASPEEVEEGICIKIEEQLKSLENIKTMHSIALEGHGSVTLELIRLSLRSKTMSLPYISRFMGMWMSECCGIRLKKSGMTWWTQMQFPWQP